MKKLMQVLNLEVAEAMVTKAGPSIGYDKTRGPWIPKPRTDVAVFQRDAEDGYSYGRTVWYVAYDNGAGPKIEPFHDTGRTHDNCHTWSVEVVDGLLKVRIGYGGHEPTITKPLTTLGLK